MTARVQISLTLPPKAIDELDRQAELVNLSRPQYVQRLLAYERQRLQLAETVEHLRTHGDYDPETAGLVEWVAKHPITTA